MRYGSVCSGIEAASVAWHSLGWEPAFFSEIEAFPRAVLAHRFPHVPLHGDFTTIKGDEYGPIDLLVGGTPCQSFSVAGLRGGLADDRGNLALEFLRLAQRTRARWLVWENVPGVLSSNGGRDFGAILGGMVELGYGIAYRVLDAQFFGVPQRRRRVFVVGHLGDWRRAAAVLFERHSLSGYPAPRREAGQRITAGTLRRTDGGSDGDHARGQHLIAGALTAKGPGAMGAPEVDAGHYIPTTWPADVAPTLNAAFGSKQGLEDQHALNGAGLFVPTVMSSGQANASVTANVTGALDCLHEAPIVAHAIQAGALRENPKSGPDGVGVQADLAYTLEARSEVQAVAHALRGEGFDASEDGTGRGTPLVPVAFQPGNLTRAAGSPPSTDVFPTLKSDHGRGASDQQPHVMVPVAFEWQRGATQNLETIHNMSPALIKSQTPAIAFSAKDHGADAGDIAPTLRAMGSRDGRPNGGGQVAVAVALRGREGGATAELGDDKAHALRASTGGGDKPHVMTTAVRRLTPVECERLQGFPDGWTQIPYRGRANTECPDGPRYKALGNSMAVPCMRWIGERIQMVEGLNDEA